MHPRRRRASSQTTWWAGRWPTRRPLLALFGQSHESASLSKRISPGPPKRIWKKTHGYNSTLALLARPRGRHGRGGGECALARPSADSLSGRLRVGFAWRGPCAALRKAACAEGASGASFGRCAPPATGGGPCLPIEFRSAITSEVWWGVRRSKKASEREVHITFLSQFPPAAVCILFVVGFSSWP